ncbi:ribosomal protein S24A [Leucoagaricus gongylophorus]
MYDFDQNTHTHISVTAEELSSFSATCSSPPYCHHSDTQENVVNMADVAPITLRTRKFITNRLLSRRQFVVDVLHPDRPNVSKADLSQKLAALYKTEPQRVVIFHSQTQYGGGKSTAFALIYDDEASQKKFEPKHRLIRSGLQTKPPIVSRKLRKERKNRAKKFRGTKKSKAAEAPKKK